MRQIPKVLIEPLESLKASFLEEDPAFIEVIKAETYPAIEEAFKNKKTFATLFEISATGHFVDIPKTSWIAALEQCIAFKIEEEDFKDCIVIQKLIEDIRNASKQPLKKSNDGAGI